MYFSLCTLRRPVCGICGHHHTPHRDTMSRCSGTPASAPWQSARLHCSTGAPWCTNPLHTQWCTMVHRTTPLHTPRCSSHTSFTPTCTGTRRVIRHILCLIFRLSCVMFCCVLCRASLCCVVFFSPMVH